MDRQKAHRLWRDHINPDFIDLIETIGWGRRFVQAIGCRLRDEDGNDILDLLAGFGVHNLGHNHPRLVEALHTALTSGGPSFLNIDAVPEAGEVAERLHALSSPDLCRTVFANSGAEAVDQAVKAARAATGRRVVIACRQAYHGLSVGTLPLFGKREMAAPFGASDAEARLIPFGDLAALARVCAEAKPALFVVEPIQAEGGIIVPPDDYLPGAARICREHGTLIAIDEIQTGLGRCGTWFASVPAELRPDALLVGKALGGGLMPAAAMLCTDAVWKKSFAGPERGHMTTSTFAGGRLAMVAARETLDALRDESLPERARELGVWLQQRLADLARRHAVVTAVRGRGLLWGLELAPPAGLLTGLVPAWAREGILAQMICLRLLDRHGVLMQPCSIAQNILRIEPPLTMARDELERGVNAIDAELAAIPSYNAAVLAATWERLRHLWS